MGVWYFSATTTPPVHRIDPEGNGVVIADWVANRPQSVTVRHFDEHGQLARELDIGAEPRPIPSGVKEALIDEGMAKAEGPFNSARQQGERVPRNLRAAVEDGLLLPDYYAPIQSMLVTRAGRIWLRETSTPDVYEGQWVVLGPDGEAEFRVPPPGGVVFRAIDGDRVWATGTNDLDVPFIVLYELVRPGGVRVGSRSSRPRPSAPDQRPVAYPAPIRLPRHRVRHSLARQLLQDRPHLVRQAQVEEMGIFEVPAHPALAEQMMLE